MFDFFNTNEDKNKEDTLFRGPESRPEIRQKIDNALQEGEKIENVLRRYDFDIQVLPFVKDYRISVQFDKVECGTKEFVFYATASRVIEPGSKGERELINRVANRLEEKKLSILDKYEGDRE